MAVSYPKELSKCSNEEIYLALLEHVKKLAAQKAGKDTTEKLFRLNIKIKQFLMY